MTATHACDAPTTLPEVELRLAIIGAGPAGLSLALQAARALPTARITVFDARPADKDVRADARTLALSQGTVQELHRMGIWDAIEASGVLEKYPEIDLAKNKVGIFAKLVKLDGPLRDQDRIEIYRPLIADPKAVRKQRAAEGKVMKKGAGEQAGEE